MNANEFEYVAAKGQGAFETISLELIYNTRGTTHSEVLTLRGIEQEAYARLGGTASSPPPGETVGRAPPMTSGTPQR
jgi:hypothetical protein